MKLLLVCNSGGHLTEMLLLMPAFENQEILFITHNHTQAESIPNKKILLDYIGTDLFKMIKAFFIYFQILITEKPDVIISTGAEIAIPVLFIGKLMRIKMVYIESWCRVNTKSGTGKLAYYLADVFLVQWPDLVKIYGKKARYEGAVI